MPINITGDENLYEGKLDKSDLYNGLDRSTTGKALDAYQGKVLNDKFNNLFETNIHIDRDFNISYRESGVWYDNDVWWRVFESIETSGEYSLMYAEITIINVWYNHSSSSATKYIISPAYTTDSQGITTLTGGNRSCHGCRFGKDTSTNRWYIDLLLRANSYHIYACGVGFRALSTPISKVSMSDFQYVTST